MAKYKLNDIAPIQQGDVPKADEYWLLNLDMVESNTGTHCKSATLLPRYPEEKVHITHPFSALRGNEYLLIERKECFGMDRVLVFDKDGNYRRFPTEWTDCCDPDIFLEISAGRAYTKPEGLIGISGLIDYLLPSVSI